MMNSLVFDEAVPPVDNVIANGGYYSLERERVEGLNKNRIIPVIAAP